MLRTSYLSAITALFVLSGSAFATVILNIPATDNPWLAGMPDGSTSGTTYPIPYDSAPANSPALYPVPFVAGESLEFSVTGAVSHGSELSLAPLTGPDGATSVDGEGFWYTSRLSPNADGSENGIADVTAPIDALIGVFLDGNPPNTEGAPPPALDFGTAASLNFTTLSPELRQPFFIGDGETSGGIVQQFIVPAGATQLFLGPMDEYNWSDNTGSFQIVATDVIPITTTFPEPGSLGLLAVCGLGLMVRRRGGLRGSFGR
jgi:hypothetical protein